MDIYECKCMNCSQWLPPGRGKGIQGRQGGWNHAFIEVPHILLCYWLFHTCITWEVKGEKKPGGGRRKEGKNKYFFVCTPKLIQSRMLRKKKKRECSGSGGSLALALHTTMDSEICPDIYTSMPINDKILCTSAEGLGLGLLWPSTVPVLTLWLSCASFRPEGPWEEAGPKGAGGKPRSRQALLPRASGYRPWMKLPISWDHRGHKWHFFFPQ